MIKLLKTTLTEEEMQKLVEATNNTRGTLEYMKYDVEMWYKVNGRYTFLTWSRFNYLADNPNKLLTIKKFKNNVYLHMYDDLRYTLTNKINNLLSIWEEKEV